MNGHITPAWVARTFKSLPILLGLSLALGCRPDPRPSWPSSDSAVEAGTGPLVLISVEALPWSVFELGWTPNIDLLASRGQARPAITASSAVLSALASLHTGRDPGLEPVAASVPLSGVSTTLAELLSQHGWETSAFVSGPEVVLDCGLDQGFATFEGGSRWARAIDALEAAGPRTFFWIHLARARPPWRRLAEKTAGVPVLSNSEIEVASAESKLVKDALRLYEVAVRSMDEQVGAIIEALDRRDRAANRPSRIVLVGSQGISLPKISAPPQGSRFGTGQDLARHQIEVPVVLGFEGQWAEKPRHIAVSELWPILLTAAGVELGPTAPGNDQALVTSRIELAPGVLETSIFDRRSSERSWTRRDSTGTSSFERFERWGETRTVELGEGSLGSMPLLRSIEPTWLPEEQTSRDLP